MCMYECAYVRVCAVYMRMWVSLFRGVCASVRARVHECAHTAMQGGLGVVDLRVKHSRHHIEQLSINRRRRMKNKTKKERKRKKWNKRLEGERYRSGEEND